MQAPAVVEQLSALVSRIVAPNPGPMTGPGTNTYLIRGTKTVVLDAGPSIPSHIEAILAATGGAIDWLVCTHTHPDHSPAAALLAERTGAEMVGRLSADQRHQDQTFQPHWSIAQDDVIRDEQFCLRAIETPGHVDNHVCYLLEEEGMVFAGDHIMNGSTVVIVPPGGSMSHYIRSLKKLLNYPVHSIAPGHGAVIEDCRSEVQKLVRHRLMREQKVVSALSREPQTLDDLVVSVYDDVSTSLYEWAKLSLEAHLIKLVEDRRVGTDHRAWWLIA